MKTDLQIESAIREALAYLQAELVDSVSDYTFYVWCNSYTTSGASNFHYCVQNGYGDNETKVSGGNFVEVVNEFKRRVNWSGTNQEDVKIIPALEYQPADEEIPF